MEKFTPTGKRKPKTPVLDIDELSPSLAQTRETSEQTAETTTT